MKRNSKWTADQIYAKTGIRERAIVSDSETSLDLGEQAAKRLEQEDGINLSNTDFVLFCTQFPDFPLPPNSTLLQYRLGIKQECGAMDFTHACSGYIYGLFLASSLMLNPDIHGVLLVTADTYTRHISDRDFSAQSIFGDAGSATYLSRDSNNRVDYFTFGTDGSQANALICESGGERSLVTSDFTQEQRRLPIIKMNGPEVFNFTLRVVPDIVARTCEKAGLRVNDFDWVVFHQANTFMLEHLRKKIGICKDKFVVDFDDCGNTVSSTIPIVLERMRIRNMLNRGNRVLLTGFGVGLSWGACVLEIG